MQLRSRCIALRLKAAVGLGVGRSVGRGVGPAIGCLERMEAMTSPLHSQLVNVDCALDPGSREKKRKGKEKSAPASDIA